jgi:protein translocation Sec62 family protein
VKRALRALESDAYKAARKKNPALPEITDRASLENAFKLLPLSMLALRVVKSDPHEGHDHGPAPPSKKGAKRTKGLWTVRIEPQQEAGDDMYYAWLWEGSQMMRKVYAALALFVIFALVCYPLWPMKLRQGGYYLSWGFLCFMGLFFAMAIFRVILFCATYFILSPGFWLFPNLWEDVSVVESFKPVWAWHEVSYHGFLSTIFQSLTVPSRLAPRRARARRPRRLPHRPAPAPPSPLRPDSPHPRPPPQLPLPPRSLQLRSSAATCLRGSRRWRMRTRKSD